MLRRILLIILIIAEILKVIQIDYVEERFIEESIILAVLNLKHLTLGGNRTAGSTFKSLAHTSPLWSKFHLVKNG